MPWKETCAMDLRTEFVLRAIRDEERFGELCQEYGISRKTGYKWKERFLSDGLAGLADLSRRPLSSPNELNEEIVCEIICIKKDHKTWGPLKIRKVFARKHPCAPLPSESSFKRILDRAGFVEKRKTRSSETCGRITNRIVPQGPNDVWTTDFKGWWYTRERQRCEPLTVRDEFSRFILCATPLADAKSDTVRRQFEKLFELHGLPRYIRSDNGTPFACTAAPLGLSRLSAWWVSLGINLDRIPPARPDQNGGHERMHRDIAAEVECFPCRSLRQQAAALETWRHTFNYERPHQALQMRVPGDLYQKSERRYVVTTNEIVYPSGFIPRKVNTKGSIRIDGARIPISSAIGGWHIGLKPVAADAYLAWFGPLCIGTVDLSTEAFLPVR
jgi:transposase InsO family protein